MNNRARFIHLIITKKLQINNRKKAIIVADLSKKKFQKFGDEKPPRTGFEYLLIMQIASLTKERYEELLRMAKEKAAELEKVKKMSIQKMWLHDLEVLEKAIADLYDKENAELAASSAGGAKGKGQKRATSRGRGRGKRGQDDEGQGTQGGDEEGDGDEAGGGGDLDNPFSDVARWTAGYLANPGGSAGRGTKRRRMK